MIVRRRQPLPDYLKPGLYVLFVGINPGLRSAALGHHFAGPSNRFWKLLVDARFVPEPWSYRDDWRLPEFGLGLTNIIRRPTRASDQLRPAEYRAGRRSLAAKIRRARPQIVALLGITIYRLLFAENGGTKLRHVPLGLSPRQLAGAPVFILPNPSGRNAHVSYSDMRRAFRRLHRLALGRQSARR